MSRLLALAKFILSHFGRFLGRFNPSWGVSLGGIAGRLMHLLLARPSTAAVQSLFGNLSREQAARTARAIGVNFGRQLAMDRYDYDRRGRMITMEGEERLLELWRRQQPVLVVFAHLGPTGSVQCALYKLGLPFLSMVKYEPALSCPDTVERLVIKSDSNRAAAALKTGLDRLRDGGIVSLAIDGDEGGSGVRVPLLGRAYPFQRGSAVLQQLTGATVIPASAVWLDRGSSIHVTFHPDELAPDPALNGREFEQEHLTLMASWLDRQMRQNPTQVRPWVISALRACPKWETSDDSP